MGEMLSCINSKSYQHSIDHGRPAFPDENFARQIMQLFSIGLDMRNMDGTPQLDEDGNPVPTYENSQCYSVIRTCMDRLSKPIQTWKYRGKDL